MFAPNFGGKKNNFIRHIFPRKSCFFGRGEEEGFSCCIYLVCVDDCHGHTHPHTPIHTLGTFRWHLVLAAIALSLSLCLCLIPFGMLRRVRVCEQEDEEINVSFCHPYARCTKDCSEEDERGAAHINNALLYNLHPPKKH